MLHNFVICGHISYQQESSQRAILDLSTSLDCGRGWYEDCEVTPPYNAMPYGMGNNLVLMLHLL